MQCFKKCKNELVYLKTTQGFDHTDTMASENREISFPKICVIFVVIHLKDMSFVWKWWGAQLKWCGGQRAKCIKPCSQYSYLYY